LRSPSKQQQQQQQQQLPRQNHIHTVFLNAPLLSKLHTAPPSTPFSPPSTSLPPRTPLLVHNVRHELKQAFAASCSPPSARVVARIPLVTRLRSSALADPAPNRFAVFFL
jgi:hypothetical protein